MTATSGPVPAGLLTIRAGHDRRDEYLRSGDFLAVRGVSRTVVLGLEGAGAGTGVQGLWLAFTGGGVAVIRQP
jgi:hypothetical protein